MASAVSSVWVAPCFSAASTVSVRKTVVARAAFLGVRPQHRATIGARPVRHAANMTTSAVAASSLYDITVQDIDGKDIKMEQFKGKVLLVANLASACGFTPQYKDLVALSNKYGSQGLEILGFPCNQFGGQEPGTNSEVKAFAQRQGAKFPLFAKSDVNGANQNPVFAYLKAKKGGLLGESIRWNFTKFLVDRNGNVVGRYAPTTNPLDIQSDIEKLL